MARKLSLIFIILIILLSGNLNFKVSARGKNQVTVSAIVLEQINFRKENNKVSVSTNYPKGFWVISKNVSEQIFEKRATLELPHGEKFIIVPQI